MRFIAAMALLVALGAPDAGFAQKKATPPGKAAEKTETDAAARESSEGMRRRQEVLEGTTMRSICSNCDTGTGAKGSGKGKKKRRQ